jgi:hypothetical protein
MLMISHTAFLLPQKLQRGLDESILAPLPDGRAGLIPAYPLGEGRRRLWRFRRADLLRWMQARRTGLDPIAGSRDWSSLFPAADAADQRTIQ